jgi:hypothetical protein
MVVVLSQVEELQAALSVAGVCELPPPMTCPQMRLQDCILQFSCDSGATWTDVDNWAASFPSCVSGVIIPPVPGNPGGTPQDQHACNLAGFIASEVMKLVVSKAVTAFNSDLTTLQFGTSIFDAIAYAFPITAIAMDVFYAFYLELNSASIAAFTAAESDPVLWSDITCAIYSAIVTVGYIDASNLGSVITNICAISYTYPVVVTALCGFITNIGLQNLQAMQNAGAVDIVDCSSCPGTWCFKWDFTSVPGPFTNFDFSGNDPVTGWGQWIAGIGWQAQNVASGQERLDLRLSGIPGSAGMSMELEFFVASTSSGGTFREVDTYLAGTLVNSYPLVATAVDPTGTVQTISLAGAFDRFDVYLGTNGFGATAGRITYITLRGTGPNPFGTTNC